MANPGQSGTPSPSRAAYGAELRRRREAAGLTQQELSETVIVSPSMIAHIEAGRRKPQLEDAKRLDSALDTGGFFERFLPTLNPLRFADHFQAAAEAEQVATSIELYAVSLVPGTMQTADYARAVYWAMQVNPSPQEIDKLVVNRLQRACILENHESPSVWAILSENVIRAVVGGRRVMTAQLRHIADLARSGRVLVQIVPHEAGAHATMTSVMTLFRFNDAPDMAYVEALYMGELVEDPALVQRCREAYDLTRAAALPPEASLTLLESVAEEYDDDD